jgi:hypothetical protein
VAQWTLGSIPSSTHGSKRGPASKPMGSAVADMVSVVTRLHRLVLHVPEELRANPKYFASPSEPVGALTTGTWFHPRPTESDARAVREYPRVFKTVLTFKFWLKCTEHKIYP